MCLRNRLANVLCYVEGLEMELKLNNEEKDQI